MEEGMEQQTTRHRDDRSTAELLRQLSQQTGDLVRHEMELAKAELREKAKAAGLGAGKFGDAGLLALTPLGRSLPARSWSWPPL
jgi:Putative Actinobacterial Holin-X, holin superfamily III